jgi:hypothetical protein
MQYGMLFWVHTVANSQLFRYCVPMDNDRPSLNLKHFEDICPDKNGMSKMRCYELGLTCMTFQVPVIAVFTKYDQFKREIKMKLEDGPRDSGTNVENEVESIFRQHYLAPLEGTTPFVRLESESFVIKCHVLLLISVLQRYTSMDNRVLILS